MGGFPVNIFGNTVILPDHSNVYHRKTVVITLLFDGEFDALVLLVYVLEWLILVLLLDNYPSVVYVSPPKLKGVWCLSDIFLLKFLLKRLARTGEKGGPHGHDVGLLIDLAIKPEVCCDDYHLK